MVSKLTISLILILIGFVIFSLYFETSLFFPQVSVQPIEAYYKTSEQEMASSKPDQPQFKIYGYPSPNWTITDLDLTIDDAFSDSNIHFNLDYGNLSRPLLGWSSTTPDMGTLNLTEASEYIRNNPPDMVITYPIMKDGTYSFYRDILELPDGTYAKTVACSPFLKQTSFDTWEGAILLDNSIATHFEDNRPYEIVTVQELSLDIKIPINYKIQNVESMNIASDSSGVKIRKGLGVGETFDLTVIDQNLQSIKSVAEIVSGLGIPGTIIAIFVSAFIERTKNKRRRLRRR